MSGAGGLAAQRCRNHPAREAAVRCPGCRRFFCRECTSEHGDRMLCAECLAGAAGQAAPRAGRRLRGLARSLRLGLAFLLTWILFLALGQLLRLIPESVHPTARAAGRAP